MENFDIIDANKLYVDLLVQCVGPTWDFCTGPSLCRDGPGQGWEACFNKPLRMILQDGCESSPNR